MNSESLGPVEKVISTLLQYTDHMVHNRPGVVVNDATSHVGVRWMPVTHKVENGNKVVYALEKRGSKTVQTRLGILNNEGNVVNAAGATFGRYAPSGLFPEVAVWMYKQVADVWKLDNEFAAKWASYAFTQDHRDLKVVLAAFMLVQSRKGDAVREDNKVIFHDEDYRDVGEAMLLLGGAGKDDKNMNPKLLLRVADVLALPQIAALNHELGFGKSARKVFLGRWTKVVEKWLRYRENNPNVLNGLVKAGFRTTVMELSRRIGYKPETQKFFEVLRWKQKQAKDGHRNMMIGENIALESWEGLNEKAVCEKIMAEKPSYKRIINLVPKSIGITRAVLAATIEAGCLTDKDLIILTPTIEEAGLLFDKDVKARWENAVKNAEDMRAANIATRVKSKEAKDALNDAADNAVKAALEEVTKGTRVYFMVDISGSMEGAIEAAKLHIARFLQGFPQDKVHIAVFNTTGREIVVKHASSAGITAAFKGISAGGGTDYGSGIGALMKYKPTADEDSLFIFVGDEGHNRAHFMEAVQFSELRPCAFGLVPISSPRYGRGTAVRETASRLNIPCFEISEATFADPYAIPRTIKALIASTPVTQHTGRQAVARVSLVDTIMKIDLLKKPAWAQ